MSDIQDPEAEPGRVSFATGRPSIRESTSADQKAINAVISRAFLGDPIAAYLFPNIHARRTGFGAFAELSMAQFAGAGMTYVTDPVQGAAIWRSPSPPPLSIWRQIGLAFRLFFIAGRTYDRAIRLSEVMERHHFKEPHWYLAILGTDPDFQGRGLGSALIEPILTRCDRESTLAYLESSKESNIPFYRRHGFEVHEEIQIPDGPIIWSMIRPPR